MKKALMIVGGIFGLLVVAFIGGAYLQPAEVTIERDIVIDAPAEKVYPHVSSFKNFNAWSPWAKIDPNTKYVFEGPEAGEGAKMSWTSDHPNVGNGSQEITAATANKRVESALSFDGQPPAKAVFVLEPAGEGKTKVTWEFHGDMGMNPIGRWMGLMIEKYLGPDYEKGLANLKEVVEST